MAGTKCGYGTGETKLSYRVGHARRHGDTEYDMVAGAGSTTTRRIRSAFQVNMGVR